MRDMQKAGLVRNVTTWSTLMNALALKGDAAASERVMRDMQKAELERNVSTKSIMMIAHINRIALMSLFATLFLMNVSDLSE